ncbi:hypothetical protein HDF26_004527 [Pedobacter cryoconitis]|uniref:hypothetical protein n=1 Tax=Pedobacter cryoconitis TaxID=188932 RepID=UPI00160756CA|nr:hypothetical protein [Pedobacter cryoconitis]MBB6274054.1 hypothetical protein [Pedobacter cryoconitis]
MTINLSQFIFNHHLARNQHHLAINDQIVVDYGSRFHDMDDFKSLMDKYYHFLLVLGQEKLGHYAWYKITSLKKLE